MPGYAALAPQRRIREAALSWQAPASFIIGHHQRLETTVTREPVAQMCHKAAVLLKGAFYGKVCDGQARPADIAGDGTILLASKLEGRPWGVGRRSTCSAGFHTSGADRVGGDFI